MALLPGRTTARRSRCKAASLSTATETFSTPSFSPRLMARIWWPCSRLRLWLNS